MHPASPKKTETTGLKTRHYKAEMPGSPRKERGESPQIGAKPGATKAEMPGSPRKERGESPQIGAKPGAKSRIAGECS